MNDRAAAARDALSGPVGLLLLLTLAIFAYRPLFFGALELPALYEVSGWFFQPHQFSPLPVLGIAGWLLWRRWGALLALPARSAPAGATALVIAGVGLFLWAQATRAPHLLLPSIAANLLAYACAVRGAAGVRAVLLPALLLVVGTKIPTPLNDELVWRLQLSTAEHTAHWMRAAGIDVLHGGVQLRRGDQPFLVIEQCSGLRGILILTLVAVLVRELFHSSGARQWLLVLAAPFLGYALNVVRVFLIATSENPEAFGGGDQDHTPQGLAVVIAGTAILYALGWAISRFGGHGTVDPAADATPRAGKIATPRWGLAAGGLLALAVLSVSTPSFPQPTPRPFDRLSLPESRAAWSGEDLETDPLFVGSWPHGKSLYRRYEKSVPNGRARVVFLFVGAEVAQSGVTSRFFTSKVSTPGSDWSIEESGPVRLWSLGLDATVARASRAQGTEHALVYSWRLRDEGIWRESSRSLLSLDASPARRDPPRTVFRLITPLANDGAAARDRAKQSLDRFIAAFRDDLAKL